MLGITPRFAHAPLRTRPAPLTPRFAHAPLPVPLTRSRPARYALAPLPLTLRTAPAPLHLIAPLTHFSHRIRATRLTRLTLLQTAFSSSGT